MTDVHPEMAQAALSKAEGSDFERFVNDFHPSLTGSEFQPLGGRHVVVGTRLAAPSRGPSSFPLDG